MVATAGTAAARVAVLQTNLYTRTGGGKTDRTRGGLHAGVHLNAMDRAGVYAGGVTAEVGCLWFLSSASLDRLRGARSRSDFIREAVLTRRRAG